MKLFHTTVPEDVFEHWQQVMFGTEDENLLERMHVPLRRYINGLGGGSTWMPKWACTIISETGLHVRDLYHAGASYGTFAVPEGLWRCLELISSYPDAVGVATTMIEAVALSGYEASIEAYAAVLRLGSLTAAETYVKQALSTAKIQAKRKNAGLHDRKATDLERPVAGRPPTPGPQGMGESARASRAAARKLQSRMGQRRFYGR